MSQEIIQETLESMKDYLPKLIEASEKLAHDIQSHEDPWVDTLLSYLDGIAWLTMAINGVQRLNLEILGSWELEALAPLLEQLEASLEVKDFVTLSDLLEYELKPLLQSYDDDLKGMIQ